MVTSKLSLPGCEGSGEGGLGTSLQEDMAGSKGAEGTIIVPH